MVRSMSVLYRMSSTWSIMLATLLYVDSWFVSSSLASLTCVP